MAPATALSQSSRPTSGRSATGTMVVREMSERIRPLMALRDELAGHWPAGVDIYLARRRILEGRCGYDPFAAVASAGELSGAFRRACAVLEGSGLSTNEDTTAVRERRFRLLSLVSSWLTGEPVPDDDVKRAARAAAAVVGNSILMAASAAVLSGWRSVESWSEASCPCCGSPPDLATARKQGRSLVCARCDTTWLAGGPGCPGCGESTPPEFVRIDIASIGCSLAMCNPCGRYLKEPADSASDPMVVRSLTLELDAVAEARGLRL